MAVAGRQTITSFEEGWNSMEQGITKMKNILEGLPEPQFSEHYMHMYTNVYNMCTQKPPYDFSRQLYGKYREVLEEYIRSVVLPSLDDKHDEFLLKELSKQWENHKVMVRWLSRFFHYLDRYFITRRSLPTLKDVGNTCFRDLVYKEMKGKARDVMLTMIHREREGDQIDRFLLKTVLELFVAIEGYEEGFEEAMLEETSRYYSIKASNWIVQDSCPSYMVKAEECLQREKDRVSHYLHTGSKGKLLEKVQKELLVVHAKQLLEKEQSGYSALLRDDKVEDLSRMYRLYSRVPVQEGLEPVSFKFQQHITAESTMLVKQVEDAGMPEHVYVRKVIELHDKYLSYVEDCCVKHSIFHKALKEAFEVFCNKEVAGSSSAEVLATFCDNILKKRGTEKLSDEAIEETLGKVVKVLAHISDKDLFGEFCRRKLARRLLFDRCVSEEFEKSLLTKLKEQYGGQFTSKMQGMITDLTLARETQSKFEEYQNIDEQAKLAGVSLSVIVLTTGFWPSYKSADVNLPKEMVKWVECFEKYYDSTTSSRKLTWIHSLGSCHINGKFGQKTIELIVTTYQVCVLLLFNESERWSYAEIKAQLNLTDDDILRLLHSLSCAKYKILNKEPNTKTISPKDQFEFNSKFTDKMRRIKIPLPPVDEEKKKVIEDVDKDRRYTIDASLVRIMKSRKVLGHQQLVAECAEQLGKMFKPDIKVIKKRIADLITRDHLERDAANPTQYKYLA